MLAPAIGMVRVLSCLVVLAVLARASQAAEPAKPTRRSRTVEARGRSIQDGIYAAMKALKGGAATPLRGGTKRFVSRARVTWAGLGESQLEEKLQRLSWLNEGQIEASEFPRTKRYRYGGVTSLGATMEMLEELSDVPIERLMPRSYVARLQKRWRSIAFRDSQALIASLADRLPFATDRAPRQTLSAHLAALETQVADGPGSAGDKAELKRQVGRLRGALSGFVRADGSLDRERLAEAADVVQYLFASPITRGRNDLTNEISRRVYYLRAVEASFPGEPVTTPR